MSVDKSILGDFDSQEIKLPINLSPIIFITAKGWDKIDVGYDCLPAS